MRVNGMGRALGYTDQATLAVDIVDYWNTAVVQTDSPFRAIAAAQPTAPATVFVNHRAQGAPQAGRDLRTG